MRRLLLSALAALAAAACSGGAEDDADADATPVTAAAGPAGEQLEVAWQVDDLRLTGQPTLAGDTIVALVIEGEQLLVTGRSLDDGDLLWEKEASPGSVVNGIAVVPHVIGDAVVYFREDAIAGGLLARLVAAEPDTGRDRWASDRAELLSPPYRCADERSICVEMRTDPTGPSAHVRFDPDTGAMSPEPGIPDGARELADGLLDLGGEPEVLAGFDSSGVRWELPASEAFSPDHSSDGGWQLVEHDGTFVGSIGLRPPDVRGARWEIDLSRLMTAGIDAATGAVRWRDTGTSFACSASISVPVAGGNDDHEVHPIRCRYRGRVVAGADVPESDRLRDIDVVVERFDPVTGETEWAVPLGAAEAMVLSTEELPLVTDAEVLVPTDDGPRVLDLLTGELRRLGADELAWCLSRVEFRYEEPLVLDGEALHDRLGGVTAAPCTADGTIVDEPPTAVPASIGAHADDLAVLATEHGLVAYRSTG